ncbi:MAG TPA: pilus assembly protein TadG-related protein [Alphaproteobacteria bacterium]|nr:pilus assembly protein TadG-related protein [Alphaproteobacteria bacterium]
MFMSRWTNFFRSLLRDTGGASIVFVAAAIVPMVGFIGLGTDAARGYLVKARLSQALDAAGLAGAQNATDTTLLQQDILMFFNANYPAGFLGSTTTGPTYTYDSVNDKLVVTAVATVPTTFMRVLGFKDMNVSATTEVTRKTQYLDIVLAMDMSGSMNNSAGGGLTRLDATKLSANVLVGILYGTAESKPLLKMGLVPWTSKVKVWIQGQTFFSVLTSDPIVPSFKNPVTGLNQTKIYIPNNSPVPLLSWPLTDWKGCVYARFLNDGDPTNDADIIEGTLTTPQGDWIAWEPIGNEGEPQPGGLKCSSGGGTECTACPNVGITPLNQSKTTITNAINALSAGGYTNIPQGLAWAWRVLTPGPPFEEAELTPDGPRVQAIVLLTDGQNWAWYGDAYKAIWGTGTPKAQMDARLLALAANIKATGVIIYVIQFADGSATLQNLLKQVATEPASPYYHYAPDPSSLTTVFTEIANHLSELRLSK